MKKIIYFSFLISAFTFSSLVFALPAPAPTQAASAPTSNVAPYKSNMRPLKENATKEETIEFVKKMEIEANKGDLDAQYGMGTVYRRGDAGWPKDEKKAVEWYTKAANMGHRAAQNSLAIMYVTGAGIEQSNEKAIEWFKKAVAQGSPEAKQSLGLMYLKDLGTPENKKEAPALMAQAANAGQPVAQMLYAALLIGGEVVDKNLEEAYKWALLSATQKVPGSKEMLQHLSSELSPSQVEAAGAAAKAWLADYLEKAKTDKSLKK